MFFIGDIHGEFDWYLKHGIKKSTSCSLQLGDFGWGFLPEKYPRHHRKAGQIVPKSLQSRDLSSIPAMPNHKFICGNHDDRVFVKEHPNYLGDFGFHAGSGIFYISGAYSIDVLQRQMWIDWWPYEELDYPALRQMLEMWGDTKPKIVVSHCAPWTAQVRMFPHTDKNRHHSRTQEAMEQALAIWEPDRWYFGHYHQTMHQTIGKTKFQCVGINQRVELPGVHW